MNEILNFIRRYAGTQLFIAVPALPLSAVCHFD